MWCFVVFFSILVLTDAYLLSDISDWNKFKKEHSKHYETLADEIHRFRIFVDHKHKISEHNLHHENGIASFRMGINKYSDLSSEEYITVLNGYKPNLSVAGGNEPSSFFTAPSDFDLPESVDWRNKNAVTEVKDQEQCGSCYTFSTTGAIESHYFLKMGQRLELSEQNLIDCSKSYGNFGCHGGSLEVSMQYIRDNGIHTEKSYPYLGYENMKCMSNVNKSNVAIHGFTRIRSGNEDHLQKAVSIHGPISVLIDAKHNSLHHYSHGIWHEPSCSSNMFDMSHAVLLVGFGTDEYDREYYILKNSWGRGWGENGYFRISRNQMNHCGIATNAVFPNV